MVKQRLLMTTRHGHGSMSISQSPSSTRTGSNHVSREETSTPQTDTMPILGSIRFVPHVEFSSRLSLNFEPMERKVVDNAHIKIGRFNEKSNNKIAVTFKSKVVSRMHAELWCENGAWYIKDAKSSSGTFVNHIRLSPPGQESKPTVLTDGDAVQFGIDFRGGTEEVYRCVRTKVEINRVFQESNDTFNKTAHKKLKSLTSLSTPQTPSDNPQISGEAIDDTASTYTAECCICLFAIAPAQALFVAPCSHAYHFKCIRPLITQHYPNFLCCVCRKYADLEASVEVESEAWLTCQAKDDPRTPTAERDEPVFSNLGSIMHDPSEATHSNSDHAPITVSRSLPASSPLANSPLATAHRLQELSLERQQTPMNHAGPFLIVSGDE